MCSDRALRVTKEWRGDSKDRHAKNSARAGVSLQVGGTKRGQAGWAGSGYPGEDVVGVFTGGGGLGGTDGTFASTDHLQYHLGGTPVVQP